MTTHLAGTFTETDARTFFAAWAEAARTADTRWFHANLAEGFCNVVRPLGLAIDKPELLTLVAGPRGVELDVVDVQVTDVAGYAVAATVAFVREQGELPEPNIGASPTDADAFIAQLRSGTRLVYQTAWTPDDGRWRCLQQTVLGRADETSPTELP